MATAMQRIGDEWRAARMARGWTQEEAAVALGLSVHSIRAIEQSQRAPSPRHAHIAKLLGVRIPDGSGGGGRSGGGQPNPRELSPDEYEAMLRACWSLFYGGKTQDALDAVQAGVRSLNAQGGGSLAMLGRFQQLAGVLARDDKRLTDAITAGAASVEIARQVRNPDHLASALFRLARTYQQADQHVVALATIAEAHTLAPRCRQPLAGWLKLCRVEVEAKAHLPADARMPLSELRRLIDQARADLANRGGEDDSYTALTGPGITHIEVLALLRDPGHESEARDLIRQAIGGLAPDQHRWRYGMMATESMAYALSNDAELAADLAEEVLVLTQANSHLRYLRRGLAALERGDPEGRNPHVVRLRRVLSAA